MLLESLVTSSRHNDRCTHGIVVKLQISCSSPFSVVTKQDDPSAAAYLCVLRRHCPVLIIGQNMEVWVEHYPSGVMTSCTWYCWVRLSISILVIVVSIIHPPSWYWPMVLVNWQLVLAGEAALVQCAECLKKFQAHFEVLHRLRLNPWACASWPLGNHSASSLPPWFSSPSLSTLFLQTLFFSVATLNGHSRDSVVPRLLTPHPHLEWPEAGGGAAGGGCWQACRGTCGGARSRDLDLCCLLERPRCSTDGNSPADGDEGFTTAGFSSGTG